MKYLKICYLAVIVGAFGCETVPMVEPTMKAQQQQASPLTTEEKAPFTYASKPYLLPAQPLAVPYSTREKGLTKFAVSDAAVVIDATTGAIDLAATMKQQPIPAGTSRTATKQYIPCAKFPA